MLMKMEQEHVCTRVHISSSLFRIYCSVLKIANILDDSRVYRRGGGGGGKGVCNNPRDNTNVPAIICIGTVVVVVVVAEKCAAG